jgi:hypothetical protein
VAAAQLGLGQTRVDIQLRRVKIRYFNEAIHGFPLFPVMPPS